MHALFIYDNGNLFTKTHGSKMSISDKFCFQMIFPYRVSCHFWKKPKKEARWWLLVLSMNCILIISCYNLVSVIISIVCIDDSLDAFLTCRRTDKLSVSYLALKAADQSLFLFINDWPVLKVYILTCINSLHELMQEVLNYRFYLFNYLYINILK